MPRTNVTAAARASGGASRRQPTLALSFRQSISRYHISSVSRSALVSRCAAFVRRELARRRVSAADVAYGVQVGRAYLKIVGALGVPPSGRKVLELGPGRTPAGALVLASHGADVMIADPFLSTWEPAYHPRFMRRFERAWGSPLVAVRQSIKQGDFAVRQLRCRAEDIGMPDESFDVVISNAVLEHVDDIRAVCRQLYRIGKRGGWQSHQVDFRDHHDFSKPLEFLTYDGPIRDDHSTFKGHWGNRIRPSELHEAFTAAGFRVERTQVTLRAEQNYFAEFLQRLRASKSAYANWPHEELRILGVQFTLAK